jgi:hypothetical protein
MSLLVPYQESRFPMYSSGLFLIPAIHSFQRKQYFHSGLLIVTAGISINYWRHASYGWRRNLDLTFSKLSFIIFILTKYAIFESSNDTWVTAHIKLSNIINHFLLSKLLFENNNPYWKYAHVMFHGFMTLEQWDIINSL